MFPNKIVPVFILLLVVIIPYLNMFSNQFLWDDEFNIVRNTYIRDLENIPSIFAQNQGAGAGKKDNFYRPVKVLSYSIVYQFFGLKPFGYHLLSIMVHVANVILIFLLIKKIFKKRSIAFITALLWGIHPVHTEAVTYMSGIADPLSVFFGLAAFLCYVYKSRNNILFYLASLFFFVLALMSKETIIILPGLIFLYEFVQNKNIKRSIMKTLPFFVMALFYFLLRLTVLNFGNTLNLYEVQNMYTQNLHYRIFTFLATLPSYYSFLSFPVNLHMERVFPIFTSLFSPVVIGSLAILVGLLLGSYYFLKRKIVIIFFGVLWFFVSFIPMSGIIPVNSIILEHWLYLPSIGFFLVVSFIFYQCLNKKWLKYIPYFLIPLIVVGSIMLTSARNEVWREPVVFYNDILQYNNGTSRVHNNLAMAYSDEGNLDKAEYHYKKAISISDTYAQTHYNLANLYVEKGFTDKAIEELEKSIQINPNFFYSYRLLYNIYMELGRAEKAQYYKSRLNDIGYY